MLDAAGLLDKQGCRGRLGNEREAAVGVHGDDDRDHHAHVALGALVEVLGELADVDAILAERGADRGSRRCLAGGNLESDVSNYFLCHLKAPLSCKILILDCFDLIKLEIDGCLSAEHGNDDADTILIGLELVHRADEALERAVSDLDGVAELIADHHFVVLDAEVVDFLFCHRSL